MIPGNVGFRPQLEEVILTAHDAIVAGDIYTVDKATATAANHGVATTTADITAADSLDETAIFVVALEAPAVGKTGRFAIRGWIKATAKAATALTAELPLGPDGVTPSNRLVENGVANARSVGFSPEGHAAGATDYVWFDGASGANN